MIKTNENDRMGLLKRYIRLYASPDAHHSGEKTKAEELTPEEVKTAFDQLDELIPQVNWAKYYDLVDAYEQAKAMDMDDYIPKRNFLISHRDIVLEQIALNYPY